MGQVGNGVRHRRRGPALAALALVAACAPSGRAAVTPPSAGAGTTTTAPPGARSTAAVTVAPTTVATTAPTRTVPPLSPDLLAGGMVLCSFGGPAIPQWA